jgi:glycosyltransferase involved in cell wall biosynthesis
MKGVSVVVCCYNSASRLPETLKHLALQHIDNSIKWEVIIVDNACKDSSVEVAKHEWLKYPDCEASFKIVSQPKPGLSYAREKGIESSCFDLILFCDDDNWLDQDFIRLGYELMNASSEIGILGTLGITVFEEQPPEWFNRLNIKHATGSQHSFTGDITKEKGAVYGAGMFMRKSIFKKMKKNGFQSLLTDRKGDSLSSGGDTEYCFYARLIGFQIYYTDQITFQHYLPKSRLSWDYNIRIFNAGGYSYSFLLLYVFLYEKRSNSWLIWKLYLINYFFILVWTHLKSIKRTIIYTFVKTEGEEYILNYSFRSGLIKGIFKNIFHSNYCTVKNKLYKDEFSVIEK